MKKLISAKEYIILVWEMAGLTYIQKLHLLVAYANFLSQKLELWMFVPCKLVNGVWVVLEEPKEFKKWLKALEINEFNYWAEGWEECREYQEAKDRVLFEGFLFKKENMISKEDHKDIYFDIYFDENQVKLYDGKQVFLINTIESLIQHSVELTETAKKQLS